MGWLCNVSAHLSSARLGVGGWTIPWQQFG